MVALERAGIPVERYVAYEIDEDAIKVSKHNYPQIERKGDVFEAEYTEGEFDLQIGGSPCTNWSIAKAGGGEKHAPKRETTASGIGWDLFSQYVRALRQVKPKYFLYENNASMSDEIKHCISEELGCEPIMIDSADFSAQTRKRYYWTNIPVAEWKKSNILFSDIIDKEGQFLTRSIEQYADTIKWSKDGMSVKWDTSGKGYYSQANRAKLPEQKWNTVCASRAESKGNVWFGNNTIRLITMSELEKLQTLPVDYTSCLKNKEMRGKCIGNGWTVDVIAHIFKGLKKEREEEEMELKVKTPTFPEVIEFNFEELKQEITLKASEYMNLVYTDEQIKDAKKDRATLNKFVKALSDERIKTKKECLKPYEDFEKKIKELDGIVSKAIKNIDDQVKVYEEQKKQEKLSSIKEYWNSCEKPFEIDFEKVMDQKWLNASVSLKSVYCAIDVLLESIAKDLETLRNLPEFGFEASEVYKTTLDINKALNEGKRLSEIQRRKAEHEAEQARLKAEAEAKKAEEEFAQHMTPLETDMGECIENIEWQAFEQTQQQKEWISFKALLTTADALALKEFFDNRNILFKPL